jgi:hypothetical protein
MGCVVCTVIEDGAEWRLEKKNQLRKKWLVKGTVPVHYVPYDRT